MNNTMIDAGALFTVILCVLGSILLLVLIVLWLKVIKTLGKINNLVDDVQEKSNKVNGVFDFVDSTTDFVNGFADKIIGGVVGVITSLLDLKKNKNEIGDNEDE